MYPSIEQQQERFIQTGEYDELPYGTIHERIDVERREHLVMRNALIDEIRSRTGTIHSYTTNLAAAEVIATRLEPMVSGLLPTLDQRQMLAFLKNSFVPLSNENIRTVLATARLKTAWQLANCFLRSVGARALSDDSPRVFGATDNGVCYLSQEYFEDVDDLRDFVVHEAAHLLCLSKRSFVGLSERDRTYVLEIDIPKHELFAHACEFYSRVLTLKKRRKDRLKLLSTLNDSVTSGHGHVNVSELCALVNSAIEAKDGWWIIRKKCSVTKRHGVGEPRRGRPGVSLLSQRTRFAFGLPDI